MQNRTSSILELNLEVTDLNVAVAIEATKLRCRYAELPTADAIRAATTIAKGCDCVLTDDIHIRQIKETKKKWV